jgi:hypothetical protein
VNEGDTRPTDVRVKRRFSGRAKTPLQRFLRLLQLGNQQRLLAKRGRLAASAVLAPAAWAQDAVRKIPAPHGEVIIANDHQQKSYDTIH